MNVTVDPSEQESQPRDTYQHTQDGRRTFGKSAPRAYGQWTENH